MSDIRYTEYKKKQRGRYSWGVLQLEGRKQNFRTVGEGEGARRKAKRLAQKLSEPPSLSGGVSGQPPLLQHGSDGDDGNPRPRGERLGPALLHLDDRSIRTRRLGADAPGRTAVELRPVEGIRIHGDSGGNFSSGPAARCSEPHSVACCAPAP